MAPEKEIEVESKSLKRRTRRSFMVALAFYGAGSALWIWARTRSEEFGLFWPFRRVLSTNESLWRRFFKPSRLAPPPPAPPAGTPPRVNGELGLEDDLENSDWRLYVGELKLTIEQIKALPRTETTCLFKCVEGWSAPISYAGVRFSDFVLHYRLGTRSGNAADPSRGLSDLFPYVGLKTPDGKYYVSIDRESMWNPQTVLAYEMNGAPLSDENGAPLRLIVPVKYGIKNLKRIGAIWFSDERPPDYWHEQGYDWYAGL